MFHEHFDKTELGMVMNGNEDMAWLMGIEGTILKGALGLGAGIAGWLSTFAGTAGKLGLAAWKWLNVEHRTVHFHAAQPKQKPSTLAIFTASPCRLLKPQRPTNCPFPS
jgi:hypothetical protein